jgi:hypothetical protein
VDYPNTWHKKPLVGLKYQPLGTKQERPFAQIIVYKQYVMTRIIELAWMLQ